MTRDIAQGREADVFTLGAGGAAGTAAIPPYDYSANDVVIPRKTGMVRSTTAMSEPIRWILGNRCKIEGDLENPDKYLTRYLDLPEGERFVEREVCGTLGDTSAAISQTLHGTRWGLEWESGRAAPENEILAAERPLRVGFAECERPVVGTKAPFAKQHQTGGFAAEQQS